MKVKMNEETKVKFEFINTLTMKYDVMNCVEKNKGATHNVSFTLKNKKSVKCIERNTVYFLYMTIMYDLNVKTFTIHNMKIITFNNNVKCGEKNNYLPELYTSYHISNFKIIDTIYDNFEIYLNDVFNKANISVSDGTFLDTVENLKLLPDDNRNNLSFIKNNRKFKIMKSIIPNEYFILLDDYKDDFMFQFSSRSTLYLEFEKTIVTQIKVVEDILEEYNKKGNIPSSLLSTTSLGYNLVNLDKYIEH